MSQWVRPLHQVTRGAAEWHAPQTKSFATTTYCGKVLEGSIEVTNNDERAEREGRCPTCATRLAAREGIVPQARPQPTPPTRTSPAKKATSPVKKAAVKTVKKTAAKKTAAKKTVRKPASKSRPSTTPVARRPVRRSQRGRA